MGIFGGVLVPPLASSMRWFITPNVVALMTLVLLRVDIAAAFGHLRRPGRLAAMVAFMLLASPVVVWGVVTALPLDPGVAAGIIISATGCGITSGAAMARLAGLDPELALLVTLATTALVPLTAPPIALSLAGVDLAITVAGLMGRLALVVGLPLALSLLIRRLAGPERLFPLGPAFDGIVVWLLVGYGFAVMDGMAAKLLADPAWVAQALVAAFAVSFGLNLLTTACFAWTGWRSAATAGLMSGNRNMALYLAVLPGGADPRIALFFGLCQFPVFLSPFLLTPLYRRLRLRR
jgi:BASS family bile acid:Na+ symporter